MNVGVILFIGIVALVIILVIVLSFVLPDRSAGTAESLGAEAEGGGPHAQPQPEKGAVSETERLLAETERLVRTIKNCVVFFVVLTAISILSSLIFYFSLSSAFGKIFG